MCHKHGIPYKRQKLRQYHINFGRIHDHFIGNTREACDSKRNRHTRIYKRTVPLCHPSVFHLHGPNLDNMILHRTESGRLDVKYHVSIFQSLFSGTNHNIRQIIYQICLYPINDFKRIFLIQFLYVMVGLGKCLHYPMVGDGNRFMPPVMSPLYNIQHIRNPVHITHLGMTVKLHPLFGTYVLSAHRKIRDFLNSCNRSDGQLIVEPVNIGHPSDFQKGTCMNLPQNLRNLFIPKKHLYHNAVCKICHCK